MRARLLWFAAVTCLAGTAAGATPFSATLGLQILPSSVLPFSQAGAARARRSAWRSREG